MGLRAFTVSVDYGDILELTLPYNRHHFDEFNVITSFKDDRTLDVAESFGCNVYCTNAFYDGGADFNKWKALEQGLDRFGRHSWVCLMDADVVWPRVIPPIEFQLGYLYTPICWVCEDATQVPHEEDWAKYPERPNQSEWAGYTQIFHADDPHLPPAPWHETNWRHAGGADSFFQRRWPKGFKIRPPFRVLHLGKHGTNWCGRVTPLTDGTVPKEASDRSKKLANYWYLRRRTRSFRHEKI